MIHDSSSSFRIQTDLFGRIMPGPAIFIAEIAGDVLIPILLLLPSSAFGPLLSLGDMPRMKLFIIIPNIRKSDLVDLNLIIRHLSEIFYDHLVARMLLIVFITLRAHVPSQVIHRPRYGTSIFFHGQLANHPLDILPVMFIRDSPRRINHTTRSRSQLLTCRTRIGRIDIQLEIGHDEEMIPKFVGKIGRVAQQRIQVPHDGNHGTRLSIALTAIVDQQESTIS